MPIYKSREEAYMAMKGQAQQASSSIRSEESIQGLKPQQVEQYRFYEAQVAKYGQYDQGILANGAHYGDQNPFVDKGLMCANCVYWRPEGACEIVSGAIKGGGICKFWIIPENVLT